MATFRVGQRVRVVDRLSDFYGQETTILRLDLPAIDGGTRYIGACKARPGINAVGKPQRKSRCRSKRLEWIGPSS